MSSQLAPCLVTGRCSSSEHVGSEDQPGRKAAENTGCKGEIERQEENIMMDGKGSNIMHLLGRDA